VRVKVQCYLPVCATAGSYLSCYLILLITYSLSIQFKSRD